MRDLKFRAWLKKAEQMCEVSSITFYDNAVWVDAGESDDYGKLMTAITFDDCELMQYTGLTDRNGKEIYEGDILKVDLLTTFGEDAIINGVVYWCNCAWWIDGTEQGGDEAIGGLGYQYHYIEVIGNKWENPELLMPTAEQISQPVAQQVLKSAT